MPNLVETCHKLFHVGGRTDRQTNIEYEKLKPRASLSPTLTAPRLPHLHPY